MVYNSVSSVDESAEQKLDQISSFPLKLFHWSKKALSYFNSKFKLIKIRALIYSILVYLQTKMFNIKSYQNAAFSITTQSWFEKNINITAILVVGYLTL